MIYRSQEAKSPEEELSGDYFNHVYNTLMTLNSVSAV